MLFQALRLVCLFFAKSQPRYAYKRYTNKIRVYENVLKGHVVE